MIPLGARKETAMKRIGWLFGIMATGTLAFGAEVKGPVKAKYSIELPDAAGDVSPIHSTDGDYPGLDVIKLSIKTDGKQLVISTTLKDPPGDFASQVVRVYFDTDKNAATG